jgi:hypothetical protein
MRQKSMELLAFGCKEELALLMARQYNAIFHLVE